MLNNFLFLSFFIIAYKIVFRLFKGNWKKLRQNASRYLLRELHAIQRRELAHIESPSYQIGIFHRFIYGSAFSLWRSNYYALYSFLYLCMKKSFFWTPTRLFKYGGIYLFTSLMLKIAFPSIEVSRNIFSQLAFWYIVTKVT